ncbi:MAG TPA: hypothetical protein VGM03_14795 [Phycisphaerae bacterium]
MEFRWNEWNLDHANRHGVTPAEAKLLVRRGRARHAGDNKYVVRGGGTGGRLIQVVYVIDPDGTVYVIHACPPGRTRKMAKTQEKELSTRKRQRAKWAAYIHPDGSFDFEALTHRQKEQLYQECEALRADAKGQPLTPAQRRLHARAQRRGPALKRRGTRIVSLSIERDLLRQAERVARVRGISRSELFSRGLRAIIAIAG